MNSLDRVATLDFETDPFDNKKPFAPIEPFCAVLFAPSYGTTVLWRETTEDMETFGKRVVDAITELPDKYIIYAHNGGKFDYMFLMKWLRKDVMFKGSAIMTASIGNHQLRDSLHICPGKLANFKKDDFDYSLLLPKNRNKPSNKKKIIDYCTSDCRYLHERVSHFLSRHGFKLSVGQAAMAALKKIYTQNMRIGENTDTWTRPFFFGGRSECIQGRVWLKQPLKMFDVNSMYPSVMAYCKHPADGQFYEHARQPTPDTIFIELECDNNNALLSRVEEDTEEVQAGSVTTGTKHGVFKTTIWEYNVAKKYNLIDNVRIIRCLDYCNRTTFSEFILPAYERRQELKSLLDAHPDKNSPPYIELWLESEDIKLLLNNSYGKFAQNPRRFKESYITDPGEQPPDDAENPWGLSQADGVRFPTTRTASYEIWERPTKIRRYNNVGIGASITGAARAKLMEAIQCAVDPYYCDTDSLLCTDLDPSRIEINPSKLGAWKHEDSWDEAIIVAKKGYYLYNSTSGKEKMRWKGIGFDALSRNLYERTFAGETVQTLARGVTLKKDGSSLYMPRAAKATAPIRSKK